jgi:hypothetical protein
MRRPKHSKLGCIHITQLFGQSIQIPHFQHKINEIFHLFSFLCTEKTFTVREYHMFRSIQNLVHRSFASYHSFRPSAQIANSGSTANRSVADMLGQSFQGCLLTTPHDNYFHAVYYVNKPSSVNSAYISITT